MKISKFFAIVITAASLSTLSAQAISGAENTTNADGSTTEITFDASSVEKSWSEQKHPFIGLTGALGFNLGLATYNRYVIGSGWAQTGWEQWDHFWTRQLTWDRDWYWTNFFLHPYQGSMYYMSCRGANLNPLESMAITVLGSASWEYLCECNAPSKNDMVYTTVGSFCVGEMFFRLSQEANEVSRLLGVAINPQRLWTEYVWQIKQKNTKGRIYSFDLGLEMGNTVAGTKLAEPAGYSEFDSQEVYPAFGGFQLYIDYRDPYTHDSNSPYDQFTLKINGDMGKGSGKAGLCAYESVDKKLFYNIRIFSDAMLWARSLNLGDNLDTSLGLTMIYDFNWHSYYMLSSLAPGFAFKQRINNENSKIEWQAQLAGIVLGTEDYFYYHRILDSTCENGTYRSYSDNIGAETLLKFKYTRDSGHSLCLDFRGYAMYDFYDQLQAGTEATGWEFVGILGASYDVPLSKKVAVGVSDELYGKTTNYRKQSDVSQLVNTAKVYAKLHLK